MSYGSGTTYGAKGFGVEKEEAGKGGLPKPRASVKQPEPDMIKALREKLKHHREILKK